MNNSVEQAKKKIAVIEDDKNLRYSIGVALKSCGYVAVLFSSCDEFLTKDPNTLGDFSLILADNRTFGTSCFKMMAILKKKKIEIPSIVMSAYGSFDIIGKSDFFKEFYYIEKPFITDELLRKISIVLEKKFIYNF